jgi:hypothetical protein
MSNFVYLPNGITPLTPEQLAEEANKIERARLLPSDYPKRLSGVLCGCKDGGDFELLPLDDEAVVSGQKRYMRCRNCGEFSHL